MNLVNVPIFESPVLLFETEQGEFAGVFEENKVLVKLNNDYPNENTKYSIYFLGACIGLDELPSCWQID